MMLEDGSEQVSAGGDAPAGAAQAGVYGASDTPHASVRPVAVTLSPSASARPLVVSELARPVFFVGFMGAGKTSVARKLARICGVASVDMDTYLERREGRRVKEIFADLGEEGFRAIETDVLRELTQKEPLLVSCGGGVVLSPENRALLRHGGFVIYLKVTADEAASRISDKSTRPLFNDLDTARTTIEGRLPLYDEVADTVIDTAGKSVGVIAREVCGVLEREGILWQRK